MTINQTNAGGSGKSVKILFLGQCLNYGYEGVRPGVTFPRVAASLLRSRYPAVDFKFDLKHLYHVRGLRNILRRRLLVQNPDIVVLGLPALFAASNWRVNLAYEMAPEVIDTARTFMRNLEAKVKGYKNKLKMETWIDRTLAVRPPVPLDEYERMVTEAVEHCQRTSECRVILMGPGAFNEDTHETYAIHTPELWAAVNQMVIDLGKKLRVPVINAAETLEGHGGEVFMLNNHRFSEYGHEVVAREVESVLAREVAVLQNIVSLDG